MTIYDIAKMLGISPATVSMALGGDVRVALKTRERVKAFAAEHGFTVDENARNFRLKKSSLVAVVVHNIATGFWAGVVKAIEDELGESHSVILCNSDGDLDKERKLVKTLVSRRVSGLIITPASMKSLEHLVALNRSAVPVVLFERTDEPSLSFVKGDDYEAARAAVREFAEGGHTRIAMLTFKTEVVGAYDRIRGFKDAIAEQGIEKGCLVFPEDNSVEAFLPQARNFSAAICLDDSLVFPLLRALKAVSLSVPDDIAILCWSNSPFLDYLYPPVSSFAIPVKEMGAEAAKAILAQLNGSIFLTRKLIPEKIFHRCSYRRLE